MTWVGKRARAIDWDERTTGRTAYTADLHPDGMLYASILRSPHPYARITRLDARPALSMPGVRGVITSEDFAPGLTYLHFGPPFSDRPPLATGVVRFIGQEVAAVAAESLDQARAAASAIEVHYRPRAAPLDIDAARTSRVRLHDRPGGATNVSVQNSFAWGHVAEARAATTLTVEGHYHYPSVTHVAMENHATLAQWDAALQRLELWTSTQVPYVVCRELAHLLGLEQAQVVCRDIGVGGGFGAKSKVCEQEVLAAALARKTGSPVLLAFDRDEEFAFTKPRHPFDVTVRVGADRNGRLRHVAAAMEVNNGAYNHTGPAVMRAGELGLGSMYRPDAVEATSSLIDTATLPRGSFRGFGFAQVSFAVESQIDELAAALKMDPLEFRLRNANADLETTLSGFKVGTSRLAECLEAVRDELNWDAKRRHRVPYRGVGVACGMHPSGSYATADANRSEATIDLRRDGSILVRFGGSDPGTGQRTILAQIAAQELGVSLDHVKVTMMDSERTPFDMGSFASRGTHMAGQAARQAARDLADKVRALAATKLGTHDIHLANGRAWAEDKSVPIGDLVEIADDAQDGTLTSEAVHIVPEMELMTKKGPGANIAATYAFAAHGAEVEVDPVTGKVSVLDYVAAHDLGVAINPMMAEGQIVGGAAMGLGAALGEELIFQDGRLVNGAFLNYAVPRAADIPPIRSVIVPSSDPRGPYGAKSVGEMSISPPPAAVANAVHDAIGIRITDLPLTPDKVLAALAERDGRMIRTSVLRRPARWWIATMRWAYPRGVHALLHRWGTRLARPVTSRTVSSVSSPVTVTQACEQLADSGAVAIGGGTDVALQRRQGLIAPSALVSTIAIEELRTIDEAEDGGLHIGASVTLHELAAQVRERCPILADAIGTIASEQIRRVATVAGNLLQANRCWFFRNGFDCYRRGGATCPCYAIKGDHRFHHAVIDAHRCQAVTPSDLATVLTGLDASVEVVGASGQRSMLIANLYTGPGMTALRNDDLITAISIPERALTGFGSFQKLALWEGDFAAVSVAVTSLGGVPWADPRVVLGAMAPVPWRARGIEHHLQTVGSAGVLASARNELGRVGHPLPRNGWKLVAAAGMVERAVQAAAAAISADAA